MEIVSQSAMRTDRPLLVVTQLSQLLNVVPGFGGLLVPLILWLSTRDRVIGMNDHGKSAVNLQLSLLLYVIICIPAILLLGLGIIGLVGTACLAFVLPIVNAIRANHGEDPSYFMTIRFIS
jgi:hypothetical protein